MRKIKETSIIRQRGQLTVPRAIRKVAAWIAPESIVTISLEDTDKIHIEPYHGATEQAKWQDIWSAINAARCLPGKKANLSKVISEDRQRH